MTLTMMAVLKIAVSQLFICVFVAVIVVNGKPPSAIVGGDLASEKQFPYLVALSLFGKHLCGGTIIDPTHVLTAAHCVDMKHVDLVLNLVIIAGTNDRRNGNKYRVKKIMMHEMYSPVSSWENDIAVITLRTSINFNEYQKAVELPTGETFANVPVVASGWGLLSYPNGTSPTELWKLDMKVISNSECHLDRTIHDSQLCATTKQGSGICVGDSGSPLVSNGTIIGISSWVVLCAKGYPDVFTRVFNYVDWIKRITGTS